MVVLDFLVDQTQATTTSFGLINIISLKLDASLDLFSDQYSWVLDNAFYSNPFGHGLVFMVALDFFSSRFWV